jgi:spermidine/putrescine transport system permease protein
MRNLLRIHILLVLGFLYLPIGFLIWYSFQNDLYHSQGLTLGWYKTFFNDQMLIAGLRNSAVIALVSSVLSAFLGLLLAYSFYKYEFGLKRTLKGLVNLILVAPDIAIAIGLMLVFQLLSLSPGLPAIIISHVTFGIGYATLLIAARFRAMTPNLEQAARDLGASEWQTIRLVLIPVIRPAITASILVCFTLSWDDFIFAFYNSSPGESTLPVQLFALIKRGATPTINAVGVVSMFVSFGLILLSLRFQRIVNIF